MDENAKKDRKKIAQKKQYGCSKHDRTDKNYWASNASPLHWSIPSPGENEYNIANENAR